MAEEEDIDLGTFDFTDVDPFGSGGPPIPHGVPFKMKITDVKVKILEDDIVPDGQGGETQAKSAMIEGEVYEPAEYTGARRSCFLRFAPFDDSEKGKKDKRRIVTTLISIGYTEEQVKAAGIGISKSMLVGTEAHMRNGHVIKDGARTYDEAAIITPDVYHEEQKRIAEHGLPEQTPRTFNTKGGGTSQTSTAGQTQASAGKGAVGGGGAGKLTKAPPGKAAGGASTMRSRLTKAAG